MNREKPIISLPRKKKWLLLIFIANVSAIFGPIKHIYNSILGDMAKGNIIFAIFIIASGTLLLISNRTRFDQELRKLIDYASSAVMCIAIGNLLVAFLPVNLYILAIFLYGTSIIFFLLGGYVCLRNLKS